jgi:regulator of RNase E activity RraA
MSDGGADGIVKELAQFSTSCLSDALDRLGVAGQVHGIRPLSPDFTLAGRAFTGLYQPVDIAGGTVGDYIDDVPDGCVIVLDNHARTDVTVWGDILTTVASRRGLPGTVIDGVCRDSNRSREVDYPIFSRATYMRTGKDRVQMVGVDVPITLGEIRVRPRDAVIGDADGVVVIPREIEDEIIEVATSIETAEQRIRDAVLAGTRLDQARKELGYHNLQSRRRSAPGHNPT